MDLVSLAHQLMLSIYDEKQGEIDMTKYYTIAPESDAMTRLLAWKAAVAEMRVVVSEVARAHGLPDGDAMLMTTGVRGLCLGRAEIPPGWGRVKKYAEYVFPMRIKANRELHARLANLTTPHAATLAKALFGTSGLYIVGLSIIRGCTYQSVEGRHVLGFHSREHFDSMCTGGTGRPVGLRPVKGSTVLRWQGK